MAPDDIDSERLTSVNIETVPLGKSSILFSSVSGCILVTNALGQSVLAYLQVGLSATEIVERLLGASRISYVEAARFESFIHDVVERWQAAGLFETARPPFPHPPKERADVVAKRTIFVASEEQFVVELDNKILSNELNQILACCNPTQSDTPAADTFRCVADIQGGFALSFNGAPIWSRTDRDEARFLLLKEAAEALCGPSNVGAVLHGAAVLGPNNRALMFIAESGSGKSTLSQGLVAQGFGFLADDHIPLSVDGRSVLSFPTAAAVKPGAMRLPEIAQLVTAYAEPWSAREGVTYLSLPPGAPLGSKSDIGAVIVPEYSADGRFDVEPLSPEDAFSACIVSGARPCRRNPQIQSLASLCNLVPFYKLRYSSSDQSIPACMDLVAK